jgi:hypothetical protein
VPKTPRRPVQPVPRFTLARKEADAALGISLNHLERRVQPELKVVISGQLVLIPIGELERCLQRHAHHLVDAESVRFGRAGLIVHGWARRGTSARRG